jgi:type IV pilus assembly protein PilA
MKNLFRSSSGFTLIELLLVIGIIAVLASIVILSVNPQRQLAQARDAQRSTDITTILNAIYQYAIDNNGKFPDTLSGTTLAAGVPHPICRTELQRGDSSPTLGSCLAGNAIAVSLRAVSGAYLKAIPTDPLVPTNSGWTRYYVTKMANGRIQVMATREVPAGATLTVTK